MAQHIDLCDVLTGGIVRIGEVAFTTELFNFKAKICVTTDADVTCLRFGPPPHAHLSILFATQSDVMPAECRLFTLRQASQPCPIPACLVQCFSFHTAFLVEVGSAFLLVIVFPSNLPATLAVQLCALFPLNKISQPCQIPAFLFT